MKKANPVLVVLAIGAAVSAISVAAPAAADTSKCQGAGKTMLCAQGNVRQGDQSNSGVQTMSAPRNAAAPPAASGAPSNAPETAPAAPASSPPSNSPAEAPAPPANGGSSNGSSAAPSTPASGGCQNPYGQYENCNNT